MALSSPQYRVGDTITMNLMMREKGTTESFPKSQWAGRKQGLAVLGGRCSMMGCMGSENICGHVECQ